jgi:hypothetical protein
MFKRIKNTWKAGRSGQPMPAQVDRSVGEAAVSTAILVSVFMVTVYGFGAAGKAVEHAFKTKQEKEIIRLEREIDFLEKDRKIRDLRSQVEEPGKGSEEESGEESGEEEASDEPTE